MADEEVREVEAPDGADTTEGTPGEPDILGEIEFEGLEPDKPIDTKPEKKEPAGEAEPDLKTIQTELQQAQSKIKDLNRALHEERKEKKALKKDTPEDEPPLSRAELKALMTEHKDDPEVMLNIVDYMAKQAAKGASKDTISKAEMSSRSQEMSTMLKQRFPALYEDGSDIRTAVDQTKEKLGFADHPYGDFVGTAVQVMMNFPTALKQSYEQGKKDALQGGAEKTRQQLVSESQVGKQSKTPGKKPEETLTASQLETAKRMGFTGKRLETYRKMLGKSVKSVSVEG